MRVVTSLGGIPADRFRIGMPVTAGADGEIIGEVVKVDADTGTLSLELPTRALGLEVRMSVSVSIEGLVVPEPRHPGDAYLASRLAEQEGPR